jgi:hypothetical protein
MTTVLTTYRVRAEHVDEHLALLQAVYAELERRRLDDVRWTTYRHGDGTSFVDLVRTDQPGRFSTLDSWAAFRNTLEHRCQQPPEILQLDLVATTDTTPPEDRTSAAAATGWERT